MRRALSGPPSSPTGGGGDTHRAADAAGEPPFLGRRFWPYPLRAGSRDIRCPKIRPADGSLWVWKHVHSRFSLWEPVSGPRLRPPPPTRLGLGSSGRSDSAERVPCCRTAGGNHGGIRDRFWLVSARVIGSGLNGGQRRVGGQWEEGGRPLLCGCPGIRGPRLVTKPLPNPSAGQLFRCLKEWASRLVLSPQSSCFHDALLQPFVGTPWFMVFSSTTTDLAPTGQGPKVTGVL